MKQNSEEAPIAIFEARDRRIVRSCGHAKSVRLAHDAVAVTRPNALMFRRVGQQERIGDDVDLRAAVFAFIGCFDFAFQEVRHQLHAVANRESRNADVQHFPRADWS